MGIDEELEVMEDDFETDAELAEEENDFDLEEEYEDDELGPDAEEEDLEEAFGGADDEYEYEDEEDDEDNEYDLGITREGVAEATDVFNTIYKEGVATAKELKDAFDDIKGAFNLGGLFK